MMYFRSLVLFLVVLGANHAFGAIAIWNGNGHAYEFVSTKLLWHEAVAAAESRTPPLGYRSGRLATFSSVEEHSFVVSNGLNDAVWFGFTDEQLEGEWRWIDNTPGIWQDPVVFQNPTQSAFTSWATGEPNNLNGEDYAILYTNGRWNDGQRAGAPFSYLVEYEPDGNVQYFNDARDGGYVPAGGFLDIVFDNVPTTPITTGLLGFDIRAAGGLVNNGLAFTIDNDLIALDLGTSGGTKRIQYNIPLTNLLDYTADGSTTLGFRDRLSNSWTVSNAVLSYTYLSPEQVVPEPATLAIWSVLILAYVGMHWRRCGYRSI